MLRATLHRLTHGEAAKFAACVKTCDSLFLFSSSGDIHWLVLSGESSHATQGLVEATHDGLKISGSRDRAKLNNLRSLPSKTPVWLGELCG